MNLEQIDEASTELALHTLFAWLKPSALVQHISTVLFDTTFVLELSIQVSAFKTFFTSFVFVASISLIFVAIWNRVSVSDLRIGNESNAESDGGKLHSCINTS